MGLDKSDRLYAVGTYRNEIRGLEALITNSISMFASFFKNSITDQISRVTCSLVKTNNFNSTIQGDF